MSSGIGLHDALNETFTEFRINRKDIAEQSGVSESMISRYLDGKNDMGSKKLQKIIDCLELDARSFFYSLIGSGGAYGLPVTLPSRSQLIQNLKSYLRDCSQREYLEVLGAIIDARQQVHRSPDAQAAAK